MSHQKESPGLAPCLALSSLLIVGGLNVADKVLFPDEREDTSRRVLEVIELRESFTAPITIWSNISHFLNSSETMFENNYRLEDGSTARVIIRKGSLGASVMIGIPSLGERAREMFGSLKDFEPVLPYDCEVTYIPLKENQEDNLPTGI